MKENREIIGYKLLKDTPTAKAGSIYEIGFLNCTKRVNTSILYLRKEDGVDLDNAIYNYKEVSNFEKWFEPIYKEEKPEFKVGDWVTYNCESEGIKTIQIEKINKAQYWGEYSAYWNNDQYCLPLRKFKYATEEEILES